MSHQICQLEETFSIQPLVNLNDKGNIFVQELPRIQQYTAILYQQMARRNLTNAVVHLCPWTNSADEFSRALLPYASYISVWHSEQPGDNRYIDEKIQQVHYLPLYPQKQEQFLVITSPTYTRALISWQHSEQETFGVLMTTSTTVRQIGEILTRRIDSACF